MADALADQILEARPTSRKGKAKSKTEVVEDVGPSIQRLETATPEPSTSKIEKGCEAQAKERKKPRKLERRSVVLEEPVVTIDMRVDRLEQQFQALSSRVDAVEVRQVRRPTAATYRRSSSTSTRATSAPRVRRKTTTAQSTTSNILGSRPSLADQLRESQRLRRTARRQRSTEQIEEIPRSALTTNNPGQARQVALTGQYNIPLPSNLTTEDVLNLKSGLTAAGSIARSLASALISTREAGSGTSTPRGTSTTRGGPTAETPTGPARSDTQSGRESDADGHEVKDGTAAAGTEGTASSTTGNRHHEERDVIGAENASKSWKSFIATAVTDLVTSAARDAAVEIHQNAVLQQQQQTTSILNTDAPAATGTGAGRRGESLPLVNEGASSTAHRRPKTSRTSSRASSLRAS